MLLATTRAPPCPLIGPGAQRLPRASACLASSRYMQDVPSTSDAVGACNQSTPAARVLQDGWGRLGRFHLRGLVALRCLLRIFPRRPARGALTQLPP
ncbi:hypothetical protein GGI43DRAFT_395821 [Trichoderma evansii]